MERQFKYRYYIIVAIVIAFSLLFIYKLYDLQIVNGALFLEETKVSHYHIYEQEAARGEIYDRNGMVLAYNRESHNVYMQRAYTTVAELNSALLILSDILIENDDNYIESIDDFFIFETLSFNDKKTKDEIIEWQIHQDLFNLKDDEVDFTGSSFFKTMRDFFEINEELSDYDAYKIIRLRYEILKNRWFWLTGDTIEVAKDVKISTLAQIAEQAHHMQGVYTRTTMTREYNENVSIAHVLGYVGPVTAEDMANDDFYEAEDVIGKTGVELYQEDYLRGTDGYLKVETDAYGNIINVIEEVKAIDGSDLYLAIDMNLQDTVMQAFIDTAADINAKADDNDKYNGDAGAGAVVVTSVDSGEILSMVSFPSYDLNWFIHDDDYSEKMKMEVLTDEVGTPSFHRAIQATYTPGSTFKPIVGVAALEEGVIEEDTIIHDDGYKVIGGWDFYCMEYKEYGWTHGDLTLKEAIKVSCNMFFYILGDSVGINDIDKWAGFFGLGEKTGIDLYGEYHGNRSNPEYKYTQFDEKWYIADTPQTSIGQLYNNFTPLQLANYTAAIANGGKVYTPYVTKSIVSPEGNIIFESEDIYTEVPWSANTARIIQEGMEGVVLDGTAEKVFKDFPIEVAGKTGTAETGFENQDSSSNGVFIAYAPVDNPQIAVSIVMEHGVWGSNAAYVAQKIFEAYFGLNYSEDYLP